jgi:hypothetical protein
MNSTPTDFEPDDQLVLPHFEEQLLSQLLEERGGEPILVPLVARRRSPRAPRRALVAAAAAVVAAAGIAGAVAVRDDDRASVSTVTQSDPELKASIIAAIDATATNTVVHTTQSGGMQLWHDPVSGLLRNSTVGADTWGQQDMGPAVAPAIDAPAAPLGTAPAVRVRRVDHCVGQYAEKDEPWFNMASEAQSFEDELKADHFVPDGTEIVDGRELIRLRAVDSQQRSERPIEERQPVHDDRVAYVDPVTLLPVRIDSASVQISTTIEYLPRTAESLALLVPPIPAGTVEVDELPPNGDPATLCNGS